MRELSLAFRLYLYAVVCCGTLLLVASVVPVVRTGVAWPLPSGIALPSGALLLLTCLGESVLLQRGGVTSQGLATPARIAAILLLPAPLPLVIAVVAIVFSDSLMHKARYKRLYNLFHTALVVGVTSALCTLVAGPLVVLRHGALVSTVLRAQHVNLLVLCMLIGLHYALDSSIMLGALATLERRPPWRSWRQLPILWPELGASTIGIIAAVAWSLNPWLIALSIFPIIALRLSFRSVEHAEDRALALRRRGEQLEAVLIAGQHLQLQQTQVELLVPVVEAARTISGAALAGSYMRDPDQPTLLERLVLAPGDSPDPGPTRLLPPAQLPESGGAWQPDGSLLIPLQYSDGVVSSLLRLAGFAGDLQSDTLDTLAILASQAAIALRNADLHEQALARASQDSLTNLLNHRAFQTCLEEEVCRRGPTGQPLSLIMIDLDDFGDINNRFGHQAGDATLIAVAAEMRAHLRATDVAARYGGDEFVLILPCTTMDEALGVAERLHAALADLVVEVDGMCIRVGASIGVASLPEHARTCADLVRVADQAAYAAKYAGKGRIGCPEDAALAFDHDVERLAARLAHANMATVEALAAAVDAKDAYTRGHSQRVGAYASLIAQRLGYAPSDVARVRLAGLLHDVGKISIPDAILCKPGRLSAEEYALLKRHPLIGADLLAAVPFLRDVLPAVRHHHERWDGAGYPAAIAGESIPLDAAVLAVADAFDAMTSNRTYRAPLPAGEACRRVREGSGTQFSPAVVHAFNRVYAEGLLHTIGGASLYTADQIA